MKILVLCDRYPYPLANGQNLRIFHYVQNLRARHTFDLICYGDDKVPEPIRPLFEHIEAFPRPVSQTYTGLKRYLKAFDPTEMLQISEQVTAHLRDVALRRGYDLIWVSGWDMIQNLPKNHEIPVLADIVDDGVLEYWREFKRSRSPGALLTNLKWLIVNYRFERHYFCPAQHVLLVADADAALLGRICPGTPVSVIHNGVDPTFFQPLDGERKAAEIVFEGNIHFEPNRDGMLYFCREILPLIQSQVPEVHFSIVGKDPPPEVVALASEHVEVTGFVDDVRPYLDRASVFVCPLRKGAGIKNKVLQAWAMGKAVVATTPSTGGLLVRDGENVLVRDEPMAFAQAVIDLLRDADRVVRMGNAARDTILEHYTWERKSAELEAVMMTSIRAYVG